MWRKQYYQNPRRLALAAVAEETQATTPTIAASLAHLDPAKSEMVDLETLPPLDASKCPQFKLTCPGKLAHGTTVRVFNQDSFDAAIEMPSSALGTARGPPTQTVEGKIFERLRSAASSPENLDSSTAARVAVLNMASDRNPGGGWLKGASAQEEVLCFRSTLAASLHRNLYPIRPRVGLYTRDVVIFRESMSDGHKLMIPEKAVTDLPVVSALSVAGIRRPDVKPFGENPEVAQGGALGGERVDMEEAASGGTGRDANEEHSKHDGHAKGKKRTNAPKGPFLFANPADRELTKDKMRLCLRMAATRGHTMLVLGAIGCGAFRNPPQEVADCWGEVLSESEFAGGWFKEVWFAVYDRRNEGNFEIFSKTFDGKTVGRLEVSESSTNES